MNSITIKSIDRYLDEVEEYKGSHYFRGQANISWDISPSIFRNNVILKSEIIDIGELYSDNEHNRILVKMLEMQHYQKPTRLCDLTVNPLVALFFALDGDSELDKDGCIYILDCSKRLSSDCFEIKVMTKLATSDIHNVFQLKDEIEKDFHIILSLDEIKAIIFRNVIVEYGYNLAFSNPRAHLQGGTMVFFGFSSLDGINIERKNNYGISNIIKQLVIPSDKKQAFAYELKKRGITSDLLYDRIFEQRIKSSNSIKYDIEIDNVSHLAGITKVLYWIKLYDVRYDYNNIYDIVQDVHNMLKRKYGPEARLWGYIYFDIEDKRSTNFIGHIDPADDFSLFIIKWNNDYHKKRMQYSNDQISSHEILTRLDPIVTEFICCWESVKIQFVNLNKSIINRDEYDTFLKDLNKKLSPLCYWDSNDIAPGGEKIYDYQEVSHELIDNIMFLIEDQLMYIDRNANNYLLNHMFERRHHDCESSYKRYNEKRSSLTF